MFPQPQRVTFSPGSIVARTIWRGECPGRDRARDEGSVRGQEAGAGVTEAGVTKDAIVQHPPTGLPDL